MTWRVSKSRVILAKLAAAIVKDTGMATNASTVYKRPALAAGLDRIVHRRLSAESKHDAVARIYYLSPFEFLIRTPVSASP